MLVTNALQYLPFANNILWIDGGVIRAQGDYREQLKQGKCVRCYRVGITGSGGPEVAQGDYREQLKQRECVGEGGTGRHLGRDEGAG